MFQFRFSLYIFLPCFPLVNNQQKFSNFTTPTDLTELSCLEGIIFSQSIMPQLDKFVLVALDDRESVIHDFCDTISIKMRDNNLPLPPAWPSVRELAGYVFQVDDPEQTSLHHIISLRDELMRGDYLDGCIWENFLDEYHLVVHSPLEQFAILPLIPMNIGNLYFSFTNPSLFMLLTLSLVLLLVHFVTKNGGGNSVPNAWQSLVELIYDFVELIYDQIILVGSQLVRLLLI